MSNARGCLVWIGRVFLAIMVLALLLAGIGYFWQQNALAQDALAYPAQGEFYQVDGRTMHLYCEGEGTPIVVLDAGLGGWSIDSANLQSELATQTTACAYDRAGYGWSDPATGERHAQAIADDLLDLLDAAEVDNQIILIGFSYSGLSSRLFTIQNPERVAGLVLLDPAHETDVSIYQGDLAQQQQSLVGIYGAFGTLARVGLVRFLEPEEIAPFAPFIPEGKPERYYTRLSGSQWWFTSQNEFSAMIEGTGADQVVQAGNLPSDLPLVVIIADGAASEEMTDFYTQRLESLQSLAAQSEQGEYVLAENIAHNDLVEQTELIGDIVRQMIDQIQSNPANS